MYSQKLALFLMLIQYKRVNIKKAKKYKKYK